MHKILVSVYFNISLEDESFWSGRLSLRAVTLAEFKGRVPGQGPQKLIAFRCRSS